MIYEDIIRDSLINAKRYERYDKTRELSKEYLKVIDELIKCINEKHENDFFFDRIHDGNEYLFRSIFLADEEEEEDMKEEEVPTSTKEDEQHEHPEIPGRVRFHASEKSAGIYRSGNRELVDEIPGGG